ncbi:MAG: hypothetical protein ABFS35_07050 [Bacteroidota bacterium]
MQKLKVVFTDSGLGGLTIMADFAKLAKNHNLGVDLIYFNAQHSEGFGYKKMDSKTQVEVFNRALLSMDKQFKPDIIAIACNTLSVVYLRSDFYKKSNTKILDIIETGKSLIDSSENNTIIEVAMPTTIESGVYSSKNKQIVAIASDTSLPGAVENDNVTKKDLILNQVFTEVRSELIKRDLSGEKTDLFLGCTHFPVIKDEFISFAKKFGIKINTLLNPNTKFSQLILEELLQEKEQSTPNMTDNSSPDKVKVISRLEFNELEIRNISAIVEKQSPETAEALRNYEYNPELF